MVCCLLHAGLAMALVLGWPAEAPAAQEPTFPRGPGFYFSLPRLVILIAIYLLWVSTCAWVDRDSRTLNLSPATWNGLMLGGGICGLVVVWLLPWFLVSVLLLVALYLAPSLAYVNYRNHRVPEENRVLTDDHLREVFRGLFKGSGERKARKEEGMARGVPVKFIGKSFNQLDEDPNRVARAETSRGYKVAREMIYEAIEHRATDIHLEPSKEEVAVRFRVDGILQVTDPFSRGLGESVINIFKVLSNLDITEKRKPQDGSFSAQVEDRIVDFRVATAGSVLGEKMVLRILDRSQQVASLTQLGMRERMQEQLGRVLSQPHGMLIVCGPTGSGKSTTLYACLGEVDRFQKNIITIENPVEYQLENITQIEIQAKAGKTFANELRSVLRQDPDVIMIGEIRDPETAEIACQSAQTGHLVLTTLHANDAVTALGRLIDLGVQPFMLGSAISAVIAQRLVRLLCPECKVRYKPNPDMLRKANLPADRIKYFYRPPEPDERKGPGGEETVCEHCGGSGYHGRTGIFEMLLITDRLRELIRDKPNLSAIKQEAVKDGMRYLQEDGLRQVIEGNTSIQEILRVSK
jgi:type II secretory ATPase GspE/PulE/Tfp pilus assembly ATPase PilB-like protein